MNITWQLAARLNGWGGQAVLNGYEAERLPIMEQVSKFAMNHALALQKNGKMCLWILRIQVQEAWRHAKTSGRQYTN